jgi:hypothetical protein
VDAKNRRRERRKEYAIAGVVIVMAVAFGLWCVKWAATFDFDLKAIAPGMTLAEVRNRLGDGSFVRYEAAGAVYVFCKSPNYRELMVIVDESTGKVVEARYPGR